MMDRLTAKVALERLHALKDKTFVELFQHGSLSIEIYQPKARDLQTPHTRDEVYVVVSGHGYFVNGNTRQPFESGELLFVPAGVVHRFEEFSEDFSTWVIFYGPEGGESIPT
jgi:mannose-6-phosphate isomerase-like protein (cupin superfamily)